MDYYEVYGAPGKYYEISAADVGAHAIRAFGRVWPCSSFIGRILPQDVGKRVYQRGDIVQVENNEQRAARLAPRPCPLCGEIPARHICPEASD